MKKPNYEDFIMKRAMDIFAEEGLKFFGIDKKVKDNGPTELVVLESKNMYMDYTFLMEDDSYIHFEFQTTDKGIDDLMRFRTYEALLNHQTKKEVITYVVYSGDIKNPISEYNCGINTYKVNAISMVNEDGDKVFDEIIDKLSSGKDIDKQDIIKLTFTPVMGGKMDKSELKRRSDMTSHLKKYVEYCENRIAMEQRKLFVSWMQNQPRRDDPTKKYSIETINGAADKLQSGLKKLGVPKYAEVNCFTITNSEYFSELHKACYSSA